MQERIYKFETVGEVLDYYMENKGLSAESSDDLIRMTKNFKHLMGKKKLRELTPDHFNAYISGRRKGSFGGLQARSTGTTRRELVHLKTAINYCERSKLVNPMDVPYIPLPPKPAPRERWLDKKEIKALKQAVKSFSRADTFVRIALATGGRKRAIETLTWKQVNFETNMITFADGSVETNKKRPTVPMQSGLREYLEQLYTIQDVINNEGFVLENDKSVRATILAAARRAGIKGVSPHVFRHTWATHASMNGVPLNEIARILGDSIVTVEKVYAKFQPGYLLKAIEQAAL